MPGIGAFIVARYPAYFDNAARRWYPMRKEIRFNASINNDDGLLANSYSRKYSLSFNQGRQLLDSDLRAMKELLEREGEVSIGRLGSLGAGDDTFVFSPFRKSTAENTNIGYIIVPAIREEFKTDRNQDMNEEDKEMTKRFDTDRNYYLPINKKGLKIAASLIVVFLAALAIILPTPNHVMEDKASVVPIVEIRRNNATEEVSGSTSSASEDEMKQEEVTLVADNADALDVPEVSEVSDCENATEYYLIVGTFRTAGEAEKFISYNKGKGYDLQTVGTKTLQRVSAKSSTDRQQLVDLLNSPEFKIRFSEAWIWTRQQ